MISYQIISGTNAKSLYPVETWWDYKHPHLIRIDYDYGTGLKKITLIGVFHSYKKANETKRILEQRIEEHNENR